MDQPTLIAIMGAALVVVVFLFFMSGESNSSSKRVKSLTTNGRDGKTATRFGFLKVEDSSQRRKQIEESLSKLEADQKTKKKQRKSLKAKIVP